MCKLFLPLKLLGHLSPEENRGIRLLLLSIRGGGPTHFGALQ